MPPDHHSSKNVVGVSMGMLPVKYWFDMVLHRRLDVCRFCTDICTCQLVMVSDKCCIEDSKVSMRDKCTTICQASHDLHCHDFYCQQASASVTL